MKPSQSLTMTFLVLIAAVNCCSCAYTRNRGADAKDIFTLALGPGIGAMGRIGPMHAGLGMSVDVVGMEGGEVGFLANGDVAPMTVTLGIVGRVVNECGRPRGKAFAHDFVGIPVTAEQWPKAPYYSQIEVSGGVVFGVRAGVNPGELLDFILGFVGIDLYGDDLALDSKTQPPSP